MTDQITDEDMARIKEAAEKATPGPWCVGPVDDTRVVDAAGNEVAQIDGDYNQPETWPLMEANASLVALARDGIPALIARLEAAEAKLAKAREALKLFTPSDFYNGQADDMYVYQRLSQLRTAARAYKETE